MSLARDAWRSCGRVVRGGSRPGGTPAKAAWVSRSVWRGAAAGVIVLVSAFGALARWSATEPLDQARMDALYEAPLSKPKGPIRVFHLGHSLVGRDMPAMLQQLAPAGHGYASQLGWGTSLKEHWEPRLPINGFETENAHPRYRDARQALASGDYHAFVMTEMVEIRDAIRWHDSASYAGRWADLARRHNPAAHVYLYETWHPLDDPEGWLDRLDRDLGRYWEGEILARAMAAEGVDRPIYVIPAGQVLARFVRALETRGGVDGLTRREDLFAADEVAKPHPIHLNDIGAYLVALTHYAVLYHASPVGLPHRLRRADGTPARAPGPAAARLMQEVVWDVVTTYPKTGVRQLPF